MPNPESIKKAADRRAARATARAENNEQAAADLLKTTELASEQAAERKATKGELPAPKKAARPTAVSRKDKQAAARVAAEKQAEADASVVAEIPAEKLDLAYYRDRGIDPPLHILNALAKENDAAIREDAREFARDVGNMVYQQASNRDAGRGRHSRERRMNRAIQEQRELQKQAKDAAKE